MTHTIRQQRALDAHRARIGEAARMDYHELGCDVVDQPWSARRRLAWRIGIAAFLIVSAIVIYATKGSTLPPGLVHALRGGLL